MTEKESYQPIHLQFLDSGSCHRRSWSSWRRDPVHLPGYPGNPCLDPIHPINNLVGSGFPVLQLCSGKTNYDQSERKWPIPRKQSQ